ncbi:MAG: hypothetical protein GX244_06265 [Firmicutes bacterium]|nr:hypothetical protein [Bacillota bacterium]
MNKKIKTLVPILLPFLLLLAMVSPANGSGKGKFYLPTHLPSSRPGYADALESPAAGINLNAPAEVRAGETFTISLVTGEGFPLLLNQEAAFFESLAGGPFALAGIAGIDDKGAAELTLRRDAAGEYIYQVRVGPFQEEVAVTVLPAKPSRIRAESENFYLEAGRPAEVKFIVEDTYGNAIRAGEKPGQYRPEKLLEVSLTTPEGHAAAKIELTAGPEGSFIAAFMPKKIGDYIVEASLKDSGLTAKTVVHVREFGNVTGIELSVRENKVPALRISGPSEKHNRLGLETTLIGQYGFRKAPSVQDDANIIFTTNRPDLLQVEEISGGKAVVIERGKPGRATVTAVYLEKGRGVKDSIDVWVAGIPAQLNFQINIEGFTAGVEATLLDKDGQPTYEEIKEYSLLVPGGVNIISKSELSQGKANFVLETEDYGHYIINMVTGDGISGSFALNFDPAAKPAEHVVLFIGQDYYYKDGIPQKLSHAPWVSYGHVFVPVDFIADIFAVEAIPYPSGQQVIFRGKDMEIVVDRAELKLTVTAGGATSTRPIGSQFLQEKNGTYFVPSGDIARLLGAQVDYLPKHEEIEHVTITMKP